MVYHRVGHSDHEVSEQDQRTDKEHDPGAAGHVWGHVMLCSDGWLGTGQTRLIMPFFLEKGLILPWSSTVEASGFDDTSL